MAEDPRASDFFRLLTSSEVRLRAFALSLIPHWADADEVLQQANLVMWQKFDAFEPGTNFYSWAAKIVHLTAKDFRKRQRRDVVQFGEEFSEVVAQRIVAGAEVLAERERVLSECIKKLTPKQKKLLEMRYREGNSGEQIAGSLGISAESVYRSLSRLRKALFDCANRMLGQDREFV